MDFFLGSSRNSWQPVMTTANTTASSYWLNWKVTICTIWVLTSMVVAFFIITKYEGPRNSRNESRDGQKESAGILYQDELWKPCLKGIHPAWLLAFRVAVFFVLLIMLILNAAVDGASIFYFYTQWTFTLCTIYFGLGSLLSMYGCFQYRNKVSGDGMGNLEGDAEQGTQSAYVQAETSNMSNSTKFVGPYEAGNDRQVARFWGYVFQIIFQMNAGAVMLTDCVFWFILVPFLTIKDYNLNFLLVNMHTINAVFLLGDSALNCLRFPWFRIAYFFMWTTVYVIFQWIVHAIVSIWWPYPFLDLSSPFAPLWYLSVALLHIPCFGVFALMIKLKLFVLSKYFPESNQCIQ